MKRILILFIIATGLLHACGFIEETLFLPQNSSPGDFFDERWSYRQPVTVDNSTNPSDLTNYGIALTIDSSNADFWNGIETDGRSVRFTDSDKRTLLDFWTERFDFTGQDAAFWVKVPSVPASSLKAVYIYYGNASATSASDGTATFIFFDDFEDDDVSDWSTLGSGGVSSEADPDPPSGSASSYSIKKISNSDPNGGYRFIGQAVDISGTGYTLEGRIYRPDPYGGGAADRLAVESSSYNGYGFIVNHTGGSNYIAIEERTGGTGSTIASTVLFNPVENGWYDFRFILKQGGIFDFFYSDGGLGESVLNRTDASVSIFDIVAIRGGYEYFVDDIRIRPYTDPEPPVSTGAQESQ
jgi:hypothetical protein